MSSPDFERLLQFSDTQVDVDQLVLIDSGFSSKVYATEDVVVKLLGHEYPTDMGLIGMQMCSMASRNILLAI